MMRFLVYVAAGLVPLIADIVGTMAGANRLLIDLLMMYVVISLITISKASRESIKEAVVLPAKAKLAKKTDGY